MSTRYSPRPNLDSKWSPKWSPHYVADSMIGESNQVLNLLMHGGAGDVARDYSGEDNHGTIHGPKWTDEDLASWGLDFDGVDDYISVGGLGSFGSNTDTDLSVSLWVKGTWTGRNDLMGEFGDPSPSGFIVMSGDAGSDGSVEIYLRDQDGNRISIYTSSGGLINDGSWHHVTITKTGNNAADLSIYVDGAEKSTNITYDESFSNPQDFNDFYLGALDYRGSSTNYLNGKLDEVRIYDRALSQSEIKDHYGATKVLYGV